MFLHKYKHHQGYQHPISCRVITNQCPYCEKTFSWSGSSTRGGAGRHVKQSVERGTCTDKEGGRPNSGLTPLQPLHDIQCLGPCGNIFDNIETYNIYVRSGQCFPEQVSVPEPTQDTQAETVNLPSKPARGQHRRSKSKQQQLCDCNQCKQCVRFYRSMCDWRDK